MKRILTTAFFLLLPGLAFAHIGADAGLHHGSAFFRGLVHPFTGLDHMAAMICVGIWSMQSFGHARGKVWVVPIAFAVLLLAGGEIGSAGASFLPIVEPMIAASLLVLGLLVAVHARLPLPAAAAMVGVFALFHGAAHGSELPAAQAQAALSGMVAGTMLLHISGMLLGRHVLARNIWLPRIAGTAVAAAGLGLLAGAF
jgi:urease accessory protein